MSEAFDNRERRVQGGFVFHKTTYRRRAVVNQSRQPLPYACLVLNGCYTEGGEDLNAHIRQSGNLHFHRAMEDVSAQIGSEGATCISIAPGAGRAKELWTRSKLAYQAGASLQDIRLKPLAFQIAKSSPRRKRNRDCCWKRTRFNSSSDWQESLAKPARSHWIQAGACRDRCTNFKSANSDELARNRPSPSEPGRSRVQPSAVGCTPG